MSADPLKLLILEIRFILDDYDFANAQKADICNRIEPRIKTYGEQCVMDYRSEKASDAISAAMHCWNPSNDHIKKKEGDPS